MSLAPNYDVPEYVSPFVQLPVLDLCTRCRTPLDWFERRNVAVSGHYVEGVCAWCSDIVVTVWAA